MPPNINESSVQQLDAHGLKVEGEESRLKQDSLLPNTEKFISIQEGGKSPNFTAVSKVASKFQSRSRPFYKKKKSLNEHQRASQLRTVSQENQVLLNRL